SMFRQSNCEQLGDHTQSRFAHTVLATVDTGEIARNGRDEVNLRVGRRIALPQCDHLSSHVLSEKVRTSHIGAQHSIPAFRRCLHDVAANLWCDAGVVNPDIDAAELLKHRCDKPPALIEVAYVSLQCDRTLSAAHPGLATSVISGLLVF